MDDETKSRKLENLGQLLERVEQLYDDRELTTYYRLVIKRFADFKAVSLEEIPLSSITHAELERFREWLRPGLTKQTPKSYIRRMRKVLRLAEKLGWEKPPEPPKPPVPDVPETVADLISLLPAGLRKCATVLRHVCKALKTYPEETSVDSVFTAGEALTSHLEDIERGRKTRNVYRWLLGKAVRFLESRGCSGPRESIPEDWQASWHAFRLPRAKKLARLSADNHISPDCLREGDLEGLVRACHWADSSVSVRRILQEFKHDIVRAKIDAAFPQLDFRRYQPWWNYSLRLDLFPEALQETIRKLVDTKIQCGQYRIVSARAIESMFSRVQGFIVNILKEPARETIAELVAPDVVVPYIRWYITVHTPPNHKTSLRRDLQMLFNAVRNFPETKQLDLRWFAALLSTIPALTKDERASRRRSRSARPDTLDTLLECLEDKAQRVLSNDGPSYSPPHCRDG